MSCDIVGQLNRAVLRMMAEVPFDDEAELIERALFGLETPSCDLQGYTDKPFSGRSRYFGLNEFRYAETGEALGTFGLGPCLGLLLVGKEKAVGAHIEVVSEPIYFLSEALRVVDPQRAYLIGGCCDSRLSYEIYEVLHSVGIPVQVAINLGGGERGAGFIFDTQTGRIHLMPREAHFLASDIQESIEHQVPYHPSEKRGLVPVFIPS